MPSEPRPDDAFELLATQPADEYALFEFAAHWDELRGVQAQLVATMRLFVISRDPLADDRMTVRLPGRQYFERDEQGLPGTRHRSTTIARTSAASGEQPAGRPGRARSTLA
jgi:hypothetical protein